MKVANLEFILSVFSPLRDVLHYWHSSELTTSGFSTENFLNVPVSFISDCSQGYELSVVRPRRRMFDKGFGNGTGVIIVQ